MKKIIAVLYESKTMVVLLILLAIAMASGTFIEDKYDTATARELIYNTLWFELLFALLVINFIGHVTKYKMLQTKRLPGFIFHLAFVIMILGAGVTRFWGYEGTMHIREGEAVNFFYSSESYLRIKGSQDSLSTDYKMNFGPYSRNKFEAKYKLAKDNQQVNIVCKGYIKNAIEQLTENQPGGKDILEIVVAGINGRERVLIQKGEIRALGKIYVAYENDSLPNAVKVHQSNGKLTIQSPYAFMRTIMAEQRRDSIGKDSLLVFRNMCLYQIKETTMMFKKAYSAAVKEIVASPKEDSPFDAVQFELTANNKTVPVNLMFEPGQVADFTHFEVGGTSIDLAYGKKQVELPFSVYLRDFILERYAGSESPSSFASEVTLIDPSHSVKLDHRIFMNNVLDYGGFRFFQSSYDRDEKGTVLSVNHDFWGTWISYTGYMLMGIGFILTLFNRTSRFLTLRRMIGEIRTERKAMVTALLLLLTFTGFQANAAADSSKAKLVVPTAQAEKFGRLITQTVDGRFEPVHTMAYDALHKISRKDHFDIEGRGSMDAMQVFLDMILHPEFWKQQKIVYIKEQSVRDVLGIKTKEAAFIDFFDDKMNYKLQEHAEKAFRKKPVDQTNFDKEIIKLDERANVYMMIFQVNILKIFPELGSPNNKWVSWDEKGALTPLGGSLKIINDDLHLPQFTYNYMMQAYFGELVAGLSSGDYTKAEKVLGYINSIQRQVQNEKMLPSEQKISAEIFYNKAKIFIFLRNFYSGLSVCLLLLAFIDNVRLKKSKVITLLLNVCIALLVLGFVYQTFGMGLRAYLLGYAPWSNGYEALLLVAWGTLVAGFSFARYSKITLAATSLLAFFVLMTASHSSYDPQMTNLTPVLKSYWLIIHVAVLTISYGFLGLGFILGLMNLFIYVFKNKINNERLDLLILELTYINEMNITIGLALATVGTFLGGVWANESWGRYWGWDAKETWALIIVVTYTLLLHLRFIPKMGGKFMFNVCSVFAYASVLMTFFGVNYFLSKGMHSYGAGDHAIFPLWAWITIFSILTLMVVAYFRERKIN